MPITNNAVVYANKMDARQSAITKIGSTGGFKDRIAFYKKDSSAGSNLYHMCVMDFDNLGEVFYEQCEVLYDKVMKEMCENDKLSSFHRRLFRAIHEEEGWKLGGKKNTMLQMLECGLQLQHHQSAPAEFLMCDDVMRER